MARKDRHTSIVGGSRGRGRRGTLRVATTPVRGRRVAGDGCDQHFPQPFGVRTGSRRPPRLGGGRPGTDSLVKGLILAQNERWRRGLGMQVERVRSSDRASGARVSKATVTNPMVGHSRGKLRVIPSDVGLGHLMQTKALAPWDGPSWY